MRNLLQWCVGLIVVSAVSLASAEIMVVVEDVVVDGPGMGSVEVYIQSTESVAPQVSGYQLQLSLIPSGSGVSFASADADLLLGTSDRNQLFSSDGFIKGEVNAGTVAAIKAPLSIQSLTDGIGLGRVKFLVEPGAVGKFDIHVVTIAEDVNFGTLITNDSFVSIPIQTQDGSITVLPEPTTAILLLLSLGGLSLHRRGRN